MKNLEKLLLDLVDIGMVVKDVVNKSYFLAIRRGISLAGQLDGERNWKACGEELLSLSNEDKAKLEARQAISRAHLQRAGVIPDGARRVPGAGGRDAGGRRRPELC